MNSCAVGFLVFSSPHQKKASIKPIYFFFLKQSEMLSTFRHAFSIKRKSSDALDLGTSRSANAGVWTDVLNLTKVCL